MIAAAVLFGCTGVLVKNVFKPPYSTLSLISLRAVVSLLVMLPIMVYRGLSDLRIDRTQFRALLGLGLWLLLVNVTFFCAINLVPVAEVIALQYTAPIVVLLVEILKKAQPMTLSAGAVVVACTLGIVLLSEVRSVGLGGKGTAGFLLGVASGISFAFYNLQGKYSSAIGLNARTTTFYSILFSVVPCLPFLPFLKIDFFVESWQTFFWLIVVSILGCGLPCLLLFKGLGGVSAFPATVVGVLEPVVAAICAYVVLHENLSLQQMAGGVVVVCAAVYAPRSVSRRYR
ncbi:EamA family transporter [Nocardia terpenica]|nr:EamA family transporter [Nocardia terpenica]